MIRIVTIGIAGILATLAVFAAAAAPASAPAEGNWNWTATGPYGAGITLLAVSPQDPSLLFVATARGSLFRSLNAGSGWSRVDTDLEGDAGPAWVTSMAFDPENGSVIYAGTRRHGLFRSTDRGRRWTRVARGLGDQAILAVAVHPRRHRLLLVSTTRGIFRSLDGGRAFVPVRLAPGDTAETLLACSFAFDPFQPSHVVAATSMGGLLHSEDAGESFAPRGSFPEPVEGLALDPTSGQILFAATPHAVSKSLDGGRTWNDVAVFSDAALVEERQRSDPPPGDPAHREDAPPEPSSPARFSAIALDPSRPDRVAVADLSGAVLVSEDGGISWRAASNEKLPAPIAALAFIPGSGSLWAATACGPYRVDGSGAAVACTGGLDEVTVSQVLPGGTGFGRVFAATDLGLFESHDNGFTWSLADVSMPCGRRAVNALAAHPARPNLLFAGGDGGLIWSEDDGATWMRALEDVAVSGIAARPGSGAPVYVAGLLGDETVVLSGDAEENDWVINLRTPKGGSPWIRSHPRLPQSLFVGMTPLRWSTDGGASWHSADLGTVRDLGIDPLDPFHILAATAEGLIESRDGGTEWSAVRWPGPSPEHILSSISAPGLELLVSGERAWLRRSASEEWSSVFLPLDDPGAVRSAALDASGDVMYVTGPWGVMRSAIPAASVPPADVVLCNPNPFRSSTRIHLAGDLVEVTSISIYSVSGGLVRTERFDTSMPREWEWNGRNDFGEPAASGLYLVIAHTREGDPVAKVTKLD